MKNQHNGTTDDVNQNQISVFTLSIEHTKLNDSMQHFNRCNKRTIKISIFLNETFAFKTRTCSTGTISLRRMDIT